MNMLPYFIRFLFCIIILTTLKGGEHRGAALLDIALQNNKSFLEFPSYFKKGVALSCYQNGGDKWGMSNWRYFEMQKGNFGKSTIAHDQKVGKSADFWNKAIDDIQLIKELGCDAVRFSIEWPSIEPEEGTVNEEALDFYDHYCDELINAGIMPTATFQHFTLPLWFTEKGGFEKEENIPTFVNYCKQVFERLNKKIKIWYTINEPTVQSFMGYIFGMHAPGKFFDFQAAGNVLKNLLNAHVEVYHELKAMEGGKEAQIGIVHQLLKAIPTSSFPMSQLFSAFINFSGAHDIFMKFFKTGNFEYHAPGFFKLKTCNELAPLSLDFIGLNYYSEIRTGSFGITCLRDEVMTDMEYPIYPRGIYEAIVEMSQLNKPIYITENGIPDAQDMYRAVFIQQYLNAVHAAIEDGFDVRGYFYWSLLDNFEWDRGFDMKFGLYDVNFDNQQRNLKEGSKIFKDYFKRASKEEHKEEDVIHEMVL